MPDRPRNEGPEDGPEYQWLYGGAGAPPQDPEATRPVRRQPRPDETRVMRTQPRASARPAPPPVAPPPRSEPRQVPTAPPPAPPAGPTRPPRQPRQRRPGRRWRPRFRFRYLLLLLILWLVYLVAVPIVTWNKVSKVDFEPSGSRPADQPGTTYLLVGSDSRAGLSAQQRKALSTGNAAGQRSDTIMLLHTGKGPNLLMSIPRDSLVPIPGHGTTKINAAYAYGGAKLLTQTVEQDTGIRVDQFVEIGLGGVAGVVDAVGGITVCPKQNMNDKLAGLHIKKGCQHVDGDTALAYARSRHTSQIGDIDRIRRQREVVAAVGKKVTSPWTILNPVRWWRINHAIPDFFEFGKGMGPVRTALWASAMTRVGGSHGLTCSVPIADLAVHWDPTRSKEMFDDIIKDDTSAITPQLCSPTGGIK